MLTELRLPLFRPRRFIAVALLAIVCSGAVTSAHVALRWNLALETIVGESRIPLALHVEARTYTMAHLAIEEAIVNVARSATTFPHAVSAADVAASSAAHQILVELLPEARLQFDAALERERAALPDGEERARAERLGREAAAFVLQKRESDQWQNLAPADPSTAMAADAPVSSNRANAGLTVTATSSPWLAARPFVLKNARQFETPVPSRLAIDGTARINYTLQDARFFNSVDRSGPAEALPRAWSGDPVITWNHVARALLATAPDDRWNEVRLLAVLNLAVADAVLAAQDARAYLGTWSSTVVDAWEPIDATDARPSDLVAVVDDGPNVTLMRAHDQRVLIPPLRDFPSVAATVSGAAEAALVACWHTDRVNFTVPDAAGEPGRAFTRISQAARESVFVATLDGRHTRAACIAGHQLGLAIGKYVGKQAAQR